MTHHKDYPQGGLYIEFLFPSIQAVFSGLLAGAAFFFPEPIKLFVLVVAGLVFLTSVILLLVTVHYTVAGLCACDTPEDMTVDELLGRK
jgi:membrane-associated phospholipid phosphatase